VGYANTFQRLFYVDCPLAAAILNITADNVFTAYLNGVEVGTGADWTSYFRFNVSLICGLNNLTVVVIHHDAGSPAALIYTLVQNLDLLILANSDTTTAIVDPMNQTTAI